jgi:LCP family protein required for cell wall assembly
MNNFKKYLLFLGATVVIGAVVLLFVYLPPKKFILSSPSRNFVSIVKQVKNFFDDQSVSILVLGKPGNVYGQITGGENLVDSIILVNFDKSKNRVNLISIPRDLWISDNNQQFKINEMIQKNKIDVAASKIEAMTGLFIDGYVIVDLATLKDVVDYLGGIDVVLSRQAVDWVSGYTLKEGVHHLNGDDVVWLVRNRFDREGDFFREKNQQQIIEKIFYKFRNLNFAEKVAFIDKFAFNYPLIKKSDIDVSKLSSIVFESDLSKITFKKIVLDFSTGLLKNEYIPLYLATTTEKIFALIPSEGFEKYEAIRKYIQDQISK